MKRFTSLLLAATLFVPAVGCKKATTGVPAQAVAPGYNSSADQDIGTTLKGLHDYYTGLVARIAADKRVPSATENEALGALFNAINVADSVYVAYHNGYSTLQEAQTALNKATTAQANLQSQIKP